MDGDKQFVLVIVVTVVMAVVIFSLIFAMAPAKGNVAGDDHKILATQIYELRADVHMLQTQVAGKQ